VLRALGQTGADYASEEGLPLGAAVEGITYAARRRAELAAQSDYDREHVTTYVKSHAQTFRVVMRPAPAPLTRPDLRFTVDTPTDLAYMRELFAAVESWTPTLVRLIDATGTAARREVA
jgi:spore coat polysaccharide biosynthesis protein SpsF